MHNDALETGHNWAFDEELLDICRFLNVAVQRGISNAGAEDYIKFFKGIAPEAERVDALPKTWRTVVKRVVEGYDSSGFIKGTYKLPSICKLRDRAVPHVIRDFEAVLADLLEDPRLVSEGNFYFCA